MDISDIAMNLPPPEDDVDDDNDDDDDDPVVKEIDVYLNRMEGQVGTYAGVDNNTPGGTSLSDGSMVYLLQYPLRPVYRPYGDHGQLIGLRQRKKSQALRLSYSLNSDGPHYDPQKRGELQNLLEVPENELTPDQKIELDELRYRHMNSQTAVRKNQGSYGLGFMRGGAFFITPVTQIVQFQPDLGHIDRMQDRGKERAHEKAEAVEAPEASTADDDEFESGSKSTAKKRPSSAPAAPAGSQGISLVSSQELKGRARLTNSELRNQEALEPWVPVKTLLDADSPESHNLLYMLSTYEVDERVDELVSMSADGDPHGMDADIFGMGSSEAEIVTADKLVVKIRRRRIGRLTELRAKVDSVLFDNAPEAYLDSLTKACMGGSKDIDTTGSTQTGPLSFMSLAKMSLPDQLKTILKHRGLESTKGIKRLITRQSTSDDKLHELLLEVSVPVHGNWIMHSPLVFEGESTIWTPYEIALRDLVVCLIASNKPLEREKLRKASYLPMARVMNILQSLCNMTDNGWTTKLEPDADFMRVYPSLNQKGLDKYSVVMARDAMRSIADTHAREAARRQQIAQHAGDASKTIDVLEFNRVKRAIEAVITEHGASSRAFITAEVKKLLRETIDKEIKEKLASEQNSSESNALLAERHKLLEVLTVVSEDDVQPILPNVAEEISGLWVLKSTGNKLLDPYRKVLLGLFHEHPEDCFTKDEILKECMKSLRQRCTLADSQFRRILQELAVNVGGRWYFKGSSTAQAKPDTADDE